LCEEPVKKALEGLNEKERFIVEYRVTRDDPLTLQDIADHFQISRERVRQVEERALTKLRKLFEAQLASASITIV
jgi:RNA polymerase sigma-32 factor